MTADRAAEYRDGPADRPRPPDELRSRMERLPPGHPSSLWEADGSPRQLAPRLRDLEISADDAEADPGDSPPHGEPAADVERPEPAADARAGARAEIARGREAAAAPLSDAFGVLDPELAGMQARPPDLSTRAGPGTVYADGREIRVTRSSADGIWVAGLPGEMPGTPYGDPYGTIETGDYLSGPEEDIASRLDRVSDVLLDRLDDVSDAVESLGNDVFTFMERGPTVPVVGHDRSPAYSGASPAQGIDGGHLLDAAVVLAALGVKVHQIVRQGREGRDAGHR